VTSQFQQLQFERLGVHLHVAVLGEQASLWVSAPFQRLCPPHVLAEQASLWVSSPFEHLCPHHRVLLERKVGGMRAPPLAPWTNVLVVEDRAHRPLARHLHLHHPRPWELMLGMATLLAQASPKVHVFDQVWLHQGLFVGLALQALAE